MVMSLRSSAFGMVVAWLLLRGGAAPAGNIEVTGFKMPTGATDGRVLTCDANGVGTWQAVPASGHDHFGASWTDFGSVGLEIVNIGNQEGYAAIRGKVTNVSERVYGVHGISDSAQGRGVYGEATATYGLTNGVLGKCYSVDGTGVVGWASIATGVAFGVMGESESEGGAGVVGRAWAETGLNYGVVGIVGSPDAYAGYFLGGKGVHVEGDLSCTGAKPFVQQHPNDPAKEIVYIALEGPEAGTYIRGTAELRDGEAHVELPDHFTLVTGESGLTVHLTPVGQWLQIYVAEKTPHRLVIREASGKNGRFDYLVQGIRKGFESHQAIRDRRPKPAGRLSAATRPDRLHALPRASATAER
jgi:hypothetical protein